MKYFAMVLVLVSATISLSGCYAGVGIQVGSADTEQQITHA